MLLQFSCGNHRSIKEPVTFSMIASKDKTAIERLKCFNNHTFVTRIAAIYGPNGSGKSNFISAIAFAKNLIVNSLKYQPGNLLAQAPHKLLSVSTPSTYDFQFVYQNIRYAYGFSIINNLIDEEYLYYFPNKRKVKIFERKGMEIFPGNQYKNSFILSRDALKENRLFLTCSANYSQVKEIENAFLFFNQDVVIYRTNVDEPAGNNWFEYSINLMEKDPSVKKTFLRFMDALGTGIRDIKTKIEVIDINQTEDLPEILKNIIASDSSKNGNVTNFQAKIVYDNFETDLKSEESTGIKTLFQIICPIMDILTKGKILIFDEIETGLHEAVVRNIIELFYKLNQDQFAQLIFTTHDTSLLDLELFRRDQIWFTELTKERATDLYSLIEIKDVRKHENIEKGYIHGKYGAIPILNQSFIA